MKDVLIRDAVPEDAPALTRLNSTAMGYDYPQAETSRKLAALLADARNKILVAQLDGCLVGYLHLVDYDVLYAEHMKNIMGIAVEPDCRRMGIGRALLAAGEAWAKENGASGVRLVSGEARTGAHQFYQSLGYVCGKRQLNFKKSF